MGHKQSWTVLSFLFFCKSVDSALLNILCIAEVPCWLININLRKHLPGPIWILLLHLLSLYFTVALWVQRQTGRLGINLDWSAYSQLEYTRRVMTCTDETKSFLSLLQGVKRERWHPEYPWIISGSDSWFHKTLYRPKITIKKLVTALVLLFLNLGLVAVDYLKVELTDALPDFLCLQQQSSISLCGL